MSVHCPEKLFHFLSFEYHRFVLHMCGYSIFTNKLQKKMMIRSRICVCPPPFSSHPKMHTWPRFISHMCCLLLGISMVCILLIVLIGVTMETIIKNSVVSHLVLCLCGRMNGMAVERCLTCRLIYWQCLF